MLGGLVTPSFFDSATLVDSYSVAATTGSIAATLAANSTLFSFRWGSTTKLAVLDSILISAAVDGVITTGVVFDLAALYARSFSASDTLGTAITLTENNQKRRTSMATSGVTDARIAATATLTPGTRTLDAQAFGRVQGFTGTTVGTAVFGVGLVVLYGVAPGDDYPLVFAANEGFIIRNPLAGPATGTFVVNVVVNWAEVGLYL